MQYPIIDLITSAYINNGWTGLDISTGKNLFNPNSLDHSWISPNNVISEVASAKTCIVNASVNEEITLSNETPSSGGYRDTASLFNPSGNRRYLNYEIYPV